jgi:hypothetical protein
MHAVAPDATLLAARGVGKVLLFGVGVDKDGEASGGGMVGGVVGAAGRSALRIDLSGGTAGFGEEPREGAESRLRIRRGGHGAGSARARMPAKKFVSSRGPVSPRM